LTGKIGSDLAAIFLGEKFRMPRERTAIALPAGTLSRYEGRFALAPAAVLTISAEGERLFAQLTGQPKIEVFAESADEFFLKVVDAQLSFRFGADGKASGITLHQGGRDMPAERVP
jgi:hypothetical protein